MIRRRRRRRRGFRRGAPQHASQWLGGVLDRYGIQRELREHRLLSHWREVVGERVADRTNPDGLSGGVLWVRVHSSPWLNELSFLKDDIVRRANEVCGRQLVREVRFHLGNRRASADDTLAPTVRIRRPPARERPLPPPARGESLARIDAETEGVADPDLRAAIREARRKLDL